MRKILFRGKRMDNGEWILGSLIKVRMGSVTSWVIFKPDFAFTDSGVKSFGHARVDPETVGQCTGLKDDNGKWVFEGDIVRYGKKTGVVNWGIGCFSVKNFTTAGFYNNPAIDIVFNEYPNYIEVIGNIYDNPELLEGGEQNE